MKNGCHSGTSCRSKLTEQTKFAYLKELVDAKVPKEIDRLSFTKTEGYERVKNILISEYGKTTVVMNECVQNIMNLPIIQLKKIH